MIATLFAALALTAFNDGWEFRWDGETAWHAATAPFDAMWGRPYVAASGYNQGYVPGGRLTCRKRFARPADAARHALRFDAVYRDSKVTLNGRPVGGRHNGYVPFEVPLDGLQETNVVEVVCDVPTPTARWYTGAGLVRDVWLVSRTGYALEPEAIAVTASVEGRDARVKVAVEGAEVTQPAGGETVIRDVELWSPERPRLYTLEVTARNAEGETDSRTVRFGVKTVEFTKDRGLLLNGGRYAVKGVCQHENYGCLGAALNRAALRRQLTRMKEMGANAVRTVHNPFAPAFFDLCDELGLLVMDEVFDEWELGKTADGYARHFETDAVADLATIVRRDRNHASLLMWSIGNEIKEMCEEGEESGRRARMWTKRLVSTVHAFDRMHPVTAGCNGPKWADRNGCLAELDVVGLNYFSDYFAKFRDKYKLIGSETTAIPASRDSYFFEPGEGDEMAIRNSEGHHDSAYSTCLYISVGDTLEDSIRIQRDSPWSAGEFSWASYDYAGEPIHMNGQPKYHFPARSSYWGICDLAGFPKDRYYLHAAAWGTKPVAHLLPDWTHPKFEGRRFPVWCYTNAEEAELFLNGRSQGVRRRGDTKDLHLSWSVAYEPGTLEVRARMKDGTVVTDVKRTAGEAAGLRFTRDFEDDGWLFVRIDAVDKSGTRVLGYERAAKIVCTGGTLVALDNGDPTDLVSFREDVRRFFRGSMLAVVRRTGTGPVTVEAQQMKRGKDGKLAYRTFAKEAF